MKRKVSKKETTQEQWLKGYHKWKNENLVHIADDGTIVEHKDWVWLQEHKKKNKKKGR